MISGADAIYLSRVHIIVNTRHILLSENKSSVGFISVQYRTILAPAASASLKNNGTDKTAAAYAKERILMPFIRFMLYSVS
jgi:hypothetical protein